MTVQFEEETACGFPFSYQEVAQQVIEMAIEKEGFPYEAEISLTMTDEDGIHEINRQFRQIDRPTDVLSFPMLEYFAPGMFDGIEEDVEDNFNPDTGEVLLGDIIICVQKVKEQAESYGHSEKREFAFLVAHSMLHLFGYDHMEPEEAAVMEQHQRDILEALGITR
ncbi:MAG: rRNA maturation RNase YbeY [Lachnospiraceae bacterium]